MRGARRGLKLVGVGILLFSLVLIGLPALLVRLFSWSGPPQSGQQGPLVHLQVQPGQVVTQPLEEYLVGVVAAEMPAGFPMEALKAQTVAARTYTLLRLANAASLTTDPATCQAWIPVSEMRRRWGPLAFSYYYVKIATAVRDTSGEVIIYQGKLIDPVYSASCGGLGTEDAEDVWGYDVPYLKGAACDWDPSSQQQPVATAFTPGDLFQRLNIPAKAGTAGAALRSIHILDRTPRGRVKDLQVAGENFKATDFRKLLGLRSTAFSISKTGNKIVLATRGNGHAVGMCQWGARGMALNGKSYQQILTYYYRGVQVVPYRE